MSVRPPLTFGYLYDFRNPEPWRRPPAQLYAETIELAAWTETIGFTGAWVPEHHAADDGYMPTPHLALAAIAARTRTIRLGAAIALAPLYHPVRFAEECAVLDILSDGRFETALAIGYRRREYAMYGEAFGKRGARFDEFLHIVRALWRGETVDFAGEHFRIEQARITPAAPRGRIPLYIGGFAEKALARVARHADGYFGNEEVCDLYVAKLAEQGRDPAQARIRIQSLFLAVADDPERAMAELAPYYHHVSNSYGAWMAEDRAIGLDDPAMKPMDLDAFKASGILSILTPDEAVAHFTAMRARMPVEHIMMMRPPGLPANRFVHYAQVFADKVISRLAT
jgi:alkanesulfonate monooxygenase SsuD/methylene tetrahydromethanopterin reductase-like flavin-dependent oxidoreductase (luciferase family)